MLNWPNLVLSSKTNEESTRLTRGSYALSHTVTYPRACMAEPGPLCGGSLVFCAGKIQPGTDLAGLPTPLRPALLDAYQRQRTLPSAYPRLIGAYCLFSRTGAYTYLLANPTEHAWLKERNPTLRGSRMPDIPCGHTHVVSWTLLNVERHKNVFFYINGL